MKHPLSENPGWSRRGFLSARGLGTSAGGLLGLLFPQPVGRGRDDRRWAHVCYSRRAMACEFSVFLPPTVACSLAAAETALDEIQRMEELLTVYSASSAMSYVNQTAAAGPVRVDNRLFTLLQRSAELTEATGGAFDVAAGALLKTWGFFMPPRRVPLEAERQSALACSGMKHVALEPAHRTVRYLREGLDINLGSIGKGYAIDRAVACMREAYGIDCVLVQGGLSSMRAVGSPHGDGRGWLIGIQNPVAPARRAATVWLRDRALGTSSSANQHFESDGRQYGHVLDPRTGWPADEIASASAIAPDAATADALATAFFVMGLDRTADFCKNHPDIAALLVLKPGEQGDASAEPRVATFNLAEGEVDLCPGQEPDPAPTDHLHGFSGLA